MTYRGKFRPKQPDKYLGDVNKIVYRSLWERNAMRWCDENPNIERWNSEEVIVPYVCNTDGRRHRYFIDLFIRLKNGQTYLVEIKPKSQTKPPKQPARKTRVYLESIKTYVKNKSKWEAAAEFAERNNSKFVIWTEDTLNSMGIKTISGYKKPKKRDK